MAIASLPSVSTAPRWQQVLHYTLHPLDYLDRVIQQNEDIVDAPVIGNYHTIALVCHPQGIRQLFSSNKCIKAPTNTLLQPIAGDRSLFCLEGQRHQKERKLVMPPFHREKISQYGTLICELTHKAMHSLTPGDTFSARDLLQEISLNVILQIVFGLRNGPRSEQLRHLIVQFTDCLQNPLVNVALFFPTLRFKKTRYSPWGYFQWVRGQIQRVLLDEVKERRLQNTSDRNDILSLLLEARDENNQPMSNEELLDELLTLLMAGHETTASAIAWTMYWVHQDSHIRDRLAQELQAIGPNPDPITLSEVPYLTAVCHETLRIYPVALLTFPREAIAPITIMGYELAPGTRIYGAIYPIHHRSDLYPDSRTFRPERFLERTFSSAEFLPFGGGIRRCIGEILAQFEMKLVVGTIVSNYTLEWIDHQPEVAKRRGVTIAPKHGVKMKLVS